MENSIISSVKDEASFSVNHTLVGELFCCIAQWNNGAMVSCCFDITKQ